MIFTRRGLAAGLASLVPATAAFAAATSDPGADRAAAAALRQLLAESPVAQQLNGKAVAVLVFPRVVKVGFLFGGAYGEGVLLQGGKAQGYYNSAAASYGLQAGGSGSVMRCSS